MTPNLKPLVTLRVKDGVAYASDQNQPEFPKHFTEFKKTLPHHIDDLKLRLDAFNNSFVQVANDVIQLLIWSKIPSKINFKPVDGDYDLSDRGMVFSVDEKCCLDNYNEISETYYCQTGGCVKQKCAVVSISNNEVDMSKWYCEEHLDKDMGHDGCSGAGVLESARVPLLTLRNRLLKQELREVKSQHSMDVINLKDRIVSYEKENSCLPEKKEVGSEYKAEDYLSKIKEVCDTIDGNLLQMPAAIQAIAALVREFETNTKPL